MDPKQPIERVAFITVLRTAEALRARFERLLKEYGLTEPQFNVLRIVRGADKEGIPSQDIGRRMITRVPDVTRLLERLEQKGLVTRVRSDIDRRVVLTRITAEGRRLLSQIDDPVDECHRRQFANMSKVDQKELIRLLNALADG
jgi:DNA-binding MarR family transcriptional regulator